MSTPMGPESTRTTCHSCGKSVSSKTTRDASTKAYISCLLLCLIGCALGCCLIPFCMESCHVVKHTCPSCNAYLGQYEQ